jgi:hypothetical protein
MVSIEMEQVRRLKKMPLSLIAWTRQVWAKASSYVPFHWSSLKGAMSSKFARLTFVVPIVGWILVYNDNLILLLEQLWETDLPNELGWRVYVFYVGLFFISVSSIIYAIFCPREISNHTDIVDYVRNFRPVVTESYEKKLSYALKRSPLNWGKPPEEFQNAATGEYPLVRKQTENEEAIIDRLVQNYLILNSSWPLLRLVALAAFCAGVVLASIPTLTTVHWASCLVVEDAGSNFLIDKFKNTCAPYFDRSKYHLEYME